MRCLECGAEMRFTNEPLSEEFKGEVFTISGIERYVCDSCGNDQMSPTSAEMLAKNLAAEYAHAHGLMSAGEIREFRVSIGLTQKEFERLIGVSSPTVSRWESGAMQQSKPVDILIRTLRDFPDALRAAMERAEIQPAPPCVSFSDNPAQFGVATFATVSQPVPASDVTTAEPECPVCNGASAKLVVAI